jgi:error-prone DNA polymerase
LKKLILGVGMALDGGYHIVLLSKNINGYGNLCRIVTKAHLSHEKGKASANLDMLREYSKDLFCLSGFRGGRSLQI